MKYRHIFKQLLVVVYLKCTKGPRKWCGWHGLTLMNEIWYLYSPVVWIIRAGKNMRWVFWFFSSFAQILTIFYNEILTRKVNFRSTSVRIIIANHLVERNFFYVNVREKKRFSSRFSSCRKNLSTTSLFTKNFFYVIWSWKYSKHVVVTGSQCSVQ